jgi:hypothetical protein
VICLGLNRQCNGRREAEDSTILRPVPLFRLDLTVWALRRRARNAIATRPVSASEIVASNNVMAMPMTTVPTVGLRAAR